MVSTHPTYVHVERRTMVQFRALEKRLTCDPLVSAWLPVPSQSLDLSDDGPQSAKFHFRNPNELL